MKLVVQSLLLWSVLCSAGGIPPEQLPTHIKVGIAASSECRITDLTCKNSLIQTAQEQALALARNSDGTLDPDTVGWCCNETVRKLSEKGEPQGVATLLSYLVPSSLISSIVKTKTARFLPTLTKTQVLSKEESIHQMVKEVEQQNFKKENPLPVSSLCKQPSLCGALQPFHIYRFDTVEWKRPITQVTGGCYILYAALVLKDLWEKEWAHEQPAGDSDIHRLVQKKSALMQQRVQEMVARYGEQEGPQIFVTHDILMKKLTQPVFKEFVPFNSKNIFIFEQEKRVASVQKGDLELWKVTDEIDGNWSELKAFLVRCTKPKEKACGCVINTFVESVAHYDRVLAFVCKKQGDTGPSMMYIDPLNRGMKYHSRARLFLTTLLRQALENRSGSC